MSDQTGKPTLEKSGTASQPPRVLGVVVADLQRAAIGTRSRLAETFAGKSVLAEVVSRLLDVRGVGEVVVLAPPAQIDQAWQLLGPLDRVQVRALEPRPASMDARVRIGRAWNLLAWRGGAGQWTVFDEEYHPAAIARAAAEAFDGRGAEHVLVVHSHGIFLNVDITSALVHHHLYKNHEMRVTFTPAAPGLSGMVLRADIVLEMGEKNVMPWQLLGYDPKAPIFDTLIREACMQVDPALSKIPNRFCVDTDRSWGICKELAAQSWSSVAQMCQAAARDIAPGVGESPRVGDWPREVEIELSRRRLTQPAHMLGGLSNQGSGSDGCDAPLARWVDCLGRANACDDLLLTFGGTGDPLLYAGGLAEILRAARHSGALSICVQTDLAGGDVDGLLSAIGECLVDVVTVTMYGHSALKYAKVAGVDLHAAVMKNMGRLAEATRSRGGVPLVVPRLLKVRDTIPELEGFFDFWIERCGWAVIDGPTDLAGAAEFRGVIDMAPPRRRPCRRIWNRMLIQADGRATACTEDVTGKLSVASIEHKTIPQLWMALQKLRDNHAAVKWNQIDPCKSCREWHRA